MRKKTIADKHDYYRVAIEKLGGYSLLTNPRIEDLGLTRGVIQAGYKEMYKIDFKGTIVDYLCYVSTLYLAQLIKQLWPLEKAITKVLIKDYAEHKVDIRNTIRLYQKHPYYFLNSIDKRIWKLSEGEIINKDDYFFGHFEDLLNRYGNLGDNDPAWPRLAADVRSFVNFVMSMLSAIEWKEDIEEVDETKFRYEIRSQLELVKQILEFFREELKDPKDYNPLWHG